MSFSYTAYVFPDELEFKYKKQYEKELKEAIKNTQKFKDVCSVRPFDGRPQLFTQKSNVPCNFTNINNQNDRTLKEYNGHLEWLNKSAGQMDCLEVKPRPYGPFSQ